MASMDVDADVPQTSAAYGEHGTHIEGIIDALPYIDKHYDNTMRLSIEKLIQDEMRTFEQPNYLHDRPEPDLSFGGSAFLQNEYQRICQRVQLDALDMTRYKLEGPPAQKKNDLQAWRDALQHAQVQFENENMRMINLELLSKFGANAWRNYNNFIDNTNKSLAANLKAAEEDINNVNRKRMAAQMEAGSELESLQQKWEELIEKNLALEQACMALERDVKRRRVMVDYRKRQTAEASAAAAAAAAPMAEFS
eukprot:gnl/Spiro4/9636_TR5108_c2_g1_i1.p1 gnl/Spiro4/9636_TR5108_c2_g1~~gnl/Spiro4/9636_TR5108_c2_g1_i1.p1  ORF type:complete len:263 (+),score=79.71 gnl/Spiro4/9636_TR5108_c2_g1_i1:36-791(+)